jgi:hypothetical protein
MNAFTNVCRLDGIKDHKDIKRLGKKKDLLILLMSVLWTDGTQQKTKPF